MLRPEAGLQVEQPLLQVTIDGVIVPGASCAEIQSLAYFSADRFRVEFAIGADEAASTAYFAGLAAQTITVSVALGLSGFTTLLVGQIDNIRIDFLNNVAVLRGRDLSALMIDAEISETFVNQTSSQIAETIAARHGLAANVVATETPVGQYYEIDHARYALGVNARATTEWNLLCWLAQLENFGLSVSGWDFTFGPPVAGTPVVLGMTDLMSLTIDMATTIPGQTMVKSWNTRSKTVVSGSAGSSDGATTTLIRPNLSSAQAQAMAGAHLASLAQHGTVMIATMPGELSLTPNAQLALVGTDSTFDQAYTIEAITRTIDWQTGFTQAVRAYAING